MSKHIDHAAESRLWIHNAVDAQNSHHPKAEELSAAYATIAVAESNLAVAERIEGLVAAVVALDSESRRRALIARALGIKEES